MKVTNDLLRNIGSLCRCVQSVMAMKFRTYGLQRGQFIFLTRIHESPSIRQTDLTAECNVDKGTTAKAVKKLEEAGLVRRSRDEKDKRVWHLSPTDKGNGLYEELIQEENRQIAVGLNGFTTDEINQLLQLIRKLQRNVQSDWLENH
ncbi:MAG: MarR family transcriptional regulator [Acidaminococcus sp.]|jgi:DNA-binding MarR family transcriptional regulator|nr:MarR family transcriptional regulator [Acidaminococcus sp.]MCI2100973.1 MarR family transcriptional regulator [Acidaminococcus sp.]MCI2115316.1 MarR family transcriptional regulator [Acidaminococcus sp.]MCI2117384.1 MarR family transcriptional regulator [Acidaminococcus sp.]